MRSGLAVFVGWLADRLFGEPPTPVHPVAWFGRIMRGLEKVTYRDARAAGVVHAGAGVSLALVTGAMANRTLGRRTAIALTVYVCVAGRMLTEEAREVIDAIDAGDLDGARERLPALVGRDSTDLDEVELTRAVIESLAENTVDAVIASLFWAWIGGAPAVLVHRAINTLDAMVGHRTKRYLRYGWASARLDDFANYVPARLGAICVAILTPARARGIVRSALRDAPHHPSPNGGVIEAAVGAALDVRLGGINRYGDRVEDRGTVGGSRPPTPDDARRAITLTNRVGGLTAALASPKR